MLGKCLYLLCTLIVLTSAHKALIASRVSQSSRWSVEREAQPEEYVSFKILLRQQNLQKLDTIFWDVSNPRHPSYGKFLTQQEVADLVAPESSTVQRVLNWLQNAGIKRESLLLFSDYIQVATDVRSASDLFATEFVHYRSTKTGNTRLRISGVASIPEDLVNDIDLVVGISELIDKNARKGVTHTATGDDDDQYITPTVLKGYYGISNDDIGSTATSQGIAAFTDYFSMGALKAFDEYYNITGVNVTRLGPDCFGNGTCDQYESDLDVQYMTSLAPGVPTLFLAHPQGAWILDWAQQLSNYPNPPLVNSISYGWPELEQCELTEKCSTLGYDSLQYVAKTDIELQKLGTMGVTVLVSSGDDGAPSYYGGSGNCPLDIKEYCVLGGCNHTSTQCAEFVVYFAANGTACQIPAGLQTSPACASYLSDNVTFIPALEQWLQDNAACDVGIEADREHNFQFYSSCQCSGLKNGTYSGFMFETYSYNASLGAIFTAEYPTSSPYVTSVGATQFIWSGDKITAEVGCSIQTGAKITTGGGFSTFQAAPDYQGAAVVGYLKSGVGLPPSYSFNTSFRGYPDISFNGHNYLISTSNNTADLDTCPCVQIPVDGTSCSSPSLAALFSIINSHLIASNASQIGFANPTLYQMFADDETAFNDITAGNNRCNRAYCCEYGYEAAIGWDPVGGLGSPVFPKMLAYFMTAKGISKN